MVNLLQKLQTEHNLKLYRDDIELIEEEWPLNNSRCIFWDEQKLNFRVKNRKIVVDTKLKKDLLELWTTEEWRNDNLIYEIDEANTLDVTTADPYLFGNKLDVDPDVIIKLYAFQINKANENLINNIDTSPIPDKEEESYLTLAEKLSPKLKQIIDKHQSALDKIVKTSRSKLSSCPLCNMDSELVESCEIFEGPNHTYNYRHHTWTDFEYYIYHSLNFNCLNTQNYTLNYRCWFCEICRESWDSPIIKELITNNFKIKKEIQNNNTLYNQMNSQNVMGDFNCFSGFYNNEETYNYDIIDTNPF